MAGIVLDKLTKIYSGGERAVDSLDLEIRDGELMVLVGPSGCGKTSVLRMVAGLEEISGGEVRIGGRGVNHVPPRDRDVAMVFQSYALYPHLTVYDNMAFGLKLRKIRREEIDRRVLGAARVLGLEPLLRRKPRALSGGQRQRVAMGRAMVREPQAFLMDEPLSNLDAKLRVRVRAEIARLQRDLAVTTLYVTHDQVEAMTLGDRAAVLRKGVLQQAGPPQLLYDRPANVFVASFLGSPAMNLVQGEIRREDEALFVGFGPHRLRVGERSLAERPALRRYEGRSILLGIRPGDLEDAALSRGAPADRRLPAAVNLRESLGREVLVHFSLGATSPVIHDLEDTGDSGGIKGIDGIHGLHQRDDPGGTDGAGGPDGTEERNDAGAGRDGSAGAASGSLPRSGSLRAGSDFLASLDPRSGAREGERVELVVDTDRLHFFDPGSGRGIYGDGGGNGEDASEKILSPAGRREKGR